MLTTMTSSTATVAGLAGLGVTGVQVRHAVLVEPEEQQVVAHAVVAGHEDLVLLERAPEPRQMLGVPGLAEVQVAGYLPEKDGCADTPSRTILLHA